MVCFDPTPDTFESGHFKLALPTKYYVFDSVYK